MRYSIIMAIQYLLEWQDANAALIADSKCVAIELRQFTLSPGYTMDKVFEELNQQTLVSLSSDAQNALRVLASRIGQESRNTTLALTRVESSDGAHQGLSFDEKRLKILALAVKPGARLFTSNLYDLYNSDKTKRHLHGMTALGWPQHNPRNFFVVAIPLEDRATAERIAEESQMRLSEEVPVESVKMSNGAIQTVDYPMKGEKNLLYLVNEPDSAVYKEPSSGEDLFKIETMLLRDPKEEMND